MKIGILSLVLHNNYGGILQAYALQSVLERMGHEVVVLTKDREIHVSYIRLLLSWGKTFVLRYLFWKDVRFFNPWRLNSERQKREQYTNHFIQSYIHTRIVKSLYTGIFDDMDAVVVGSDQVWRSIYFKNQWGTAMDDAFLKFQEHSTMKRIAYAASFGTDEWEYTDEETKACAFLLRKFDAVSVREKSAIEICKDRLGCLDAIQTVDPTLLLTKQDYICLVENAHVQCSSGNLMCYILDDTEEKQMLIMRIAKERGQIPFYANSMIADASAPQSERIQPPVEQWLRGFMDAEFVITDSFHACVFSIIFGKPFVVIGNKERGMARFKSLLSMFSLEKNLICDPEEYNATFSYEVNENAYTLLEEKKKLSMSFLMKSLS
jgi:hypothetical protein